MGEVLVGLGLLVGGGALILGVFGNRIFRGSSGSEPRRAVKTLIEDEPKEPNDDVDEKPRERLATLGPGHFIQMMLDNMEMTEHQVMAALRLNEMRLYRGSRDWTHSGTRFPALYLKGGLLFLQAAGQWYLFTKRRVLPPDGVNFFKQYAQQFGASDQTADVRFLFEGKTWHLSDIGIYQADVRGQAHVSQGMDVKFLLARDGDNALWVEDARMGDDSAWIGTTVDPDVLVTKII